MNRHTRAKGFTLVEVILAFALMTLALIMIFSFMLAGQRFFKHNAARADIQGQMRVVMLGLKEELKTAASGSVMLVETPSNIADAIAYIHGAAASSDERLIYDNGSGRLMRLHAGAGEARPAYIDLKLPDFDVSFTVADGNPSLIIVTLTSGDVTLTGELALRNAEALAFNSDPANIYPADSTVHYAGIMLTPAR